VTGERGPSAPDEERGGGNGFPPHHTRFQKGKSGNPKGRPKGSKNFKTCLAEELGQFVTFTENGKRKRVRKRQALAKRLVNNALNDNPRAMGQVLDEIARAEGSSHESIPAYQFDRREDAFVMESIIRRIRMAKERLANADCPEVKTENGP